MSQYLSKITSIIWWFLLVGFFLAANISIVESDLTTIEYVACNTNKLDENDPFFDEVYDILDQIIVEAPEQPNMAFASINAEHEGAVAYGFGDCDPDNSKDDCTLCMNSCTLAFDQYCGPAVGAQVSMTGCYMRYENYPF